MARDRVAEQGTRPESPKGALEDSIMYWALISLCMAQQHTTHVPYGLFQCFGVHAQDSECGIIYKGASVGVTPAHSSTLLPCFRLSGGRHQALNTEDGGSFR